jgi:hypothetical protein
MYFQNAVWNLDFLPSFSFGIFLFCHISKNLLKFILTTFCPAFWWRRMNVCSVYSAFTSKSEFLEAFNTLKYSGDYANHLTSKNSEFYTRCLCLFMCFIWFPV